MALARHAPPTHPVYTLFMAEPLTHSEANRRLLAAVAAAREWDRDEASRWRNASPQERAREVNQLLRTAEAMARSAGITVPERALKYPVFAKLPEE